MAIEFTRKRQGHRRQNSAFVLSCVEKIAGEKITVLSAGTGWNGRKRVPLPSYSQWRNSRSRKSAGTQLPEAFLQSDAYTFFRKAWRCDGHRPTGNNLRDLRIL